MIFLAILRKSKERKRKFYSRLLFDETIKGKKNLSSQGGDFFEWFPLKNTTLI